MIRALIIDDEPLAHEVILHHLKQHQDIKVVGQCYNATEALVKLAKEKIDLLFLDINMPQLSGIEFLKVLANKPQVIIISAYQDYAFEGFELDVTDYLLKPVSAQRLEQALNKVRNSVKQITQADITNHQPQSIVLKVGKEKRKYLLENISMLEAYGNYVKVYQGKTSDLANSTLKQLIEQLPQTQFIQVQKSYIVNKMHVSAVDKDYVSLSECQKVKIGKSFKVAAQNLI